MSSKTLNPDINPPLIAVEIDKFIFDTQLLLSLNLDWLSNPYGRCYRHVKQENYTKLYLPEVYKGNNNYLTVTPDNKKKGQCFFIVSKGDYLDAHKFQTSKIKYTVGVVFNCNLQKINKDASLNEDFTQNLIRDARQVINFNSTYELKFISEEREEREIYREFSTDDLQRYLHSPLTAFRLNFEVVLNEDCGQSYDPALAILQNLTNEEKLNIILPSFDFTDSLVFGSLTAQQKADLTNLL